MPMGDVFAAGAEKHQAAAAYISCLNRIRRLFDSNACRVKRIARIHELDPNPVA